MTERNVKNVFERKNSDITLIGRVVMEDVEFINHPVPKLSGIRRIARKVWWFLSQFQELLHLKINGNKYVSFVYYPGRWGIGISGQWSDQYRGIECFVGPFRFEACVLPQEPDEFEDLYHD